MNKNEIKKAARNAEIYAELHYDKINNGVYKIILPPSEEFARILRRANLHDGRGNQVLDFSCGEGRNLEYLCWLGYSARGTEVSKSAVNATKKRMDLAKITTSVDHLDIAPGPAKLPYADRSFDLIVAWQCMHWVGSKEAFLFYLREFKRCLNGGGGLILTMPAEGHALRIRSLECGESQYRIVGMRRDC